MSAYMIAEVDVNDPDVYADYVKRVPATVEAFGGRFAVRGGPTELLEGEPAPRRIVVLEFENAERAKAWWDSDVYRPLRDMRQSASEGRLFIVEGHDPAS